jgi:hypothetical protein
MFIAFVVFSDSSADLTFELTRQCQQFAQVKLTNSLEAYPCKENPQLITSVMQIARGSFRVG